jgi:uncharacterized protein YjbI with pentapeptide repeats
MKRIPPGVGAATPSLFATVCSAICLKAFLTTISASAATHAQTKPGGFKPAEKWVVTQVTVGEIADLDAALNVDRTKKFPEEKDRKLRAHFLEDLLTGVLPGVKLHRHGVRIKGAIMDEPIDLENAQIPCEVELEDCQFSAGGTTFRSASFAGRVSFDNSTFKGDADFSRVKVEGDAFFNDATFEDVTPFTGADIAGNFQAQKAKFKKEGTAWFSGMKVGGDASFNDAIFEDMVQFTGADIAGNFQAQKAKFKNEKRGIWFNRVKVGGDADFSGAVFEGSAFFFFSDIGNNFAADAKFLGKKHFVSFGSMKVGGDASFYHAVFEGEADFSLINASSLSASAKFQNSAVFMHMKIRGDANFSGTVFDGPVLFDRADIGNDFDAVGVKFHEVSFSGMRVGGDTSFNHAVFQERANFAYADFGRLDLSEASWPKGAAQFHMQGMSFKYILAAPIESQSHKALVSVVDQSAYTADAYSNLEAFFLRQGYRADADEAFIAGKHREREEYFRSGYWFRWLGSWMLYLLVGYGRRPWQAGIPCAVLVALGCILFSPKKMEAQKPEDRPRVYNRFWYSLGLFLPFVDLQSNKVWKPKADQTFLRNYMRVHILLGWILVPLVLAAVTGLIK